MLDECREECLKLAEAKSQLEREVNLHRIANGDRRPLLELNEETIGQLRGIIQRQKHVIDELRNQCTSLATRLESVSTSYSDQVAKLGHQLGESLSQIQIQEGQSKQYGQMYEVCCRKVQSLEAENQRLSEDVERLTRGQQQKVTFVPTNGMTNSVQRGRYQQQQSKAPKANEGQYTSVERDQKHYQQQEAIVIEQNGQIVSPFSTKNR